MHSPDCRGPYTPDQTSCYCGFSRYQYYERTIHNLVDMMDVSWCYSDQHDQAVEELKLAVAHHIMWKKFAMDLLAKVTDTSVDLWLDEKLPPVEILDRPDAVDDIAARLREVGGW